MESCWIVCSIIFLTSPDYNLNHTATTMVVGTNDFKLITVYPIPKSFIHATFLVSPDFVVKLGSINCSIFYPYDNDSKDGLTWSQIITFKNTRYIPACEGRRKRFLVNEKATT